MNMGMRLRLVVGVLVNIILLQAVFVNAQNITGDGWEWYCVGACLQDAVSTPSPGAVLMGGGLDVDAAFKWMIQKSGGGNFLVLRTSGDDAYNPYIYAMGGIQSVATFVLTSRKASSDPFVLSQIKNAEAIWFAGGDQPVYIDYWNGTLVQTLVQALIEKGTPVGGISAGMAILPQFVYTSMDGSATSEASLLDPYNENVTLGADFLCVPFLQNIITDMHFVQRDRMGRSLISYIFLSRLIQDGWTESSVVRAVCGDEQTAVLLDTVSGIGTITSPNGTANVYFLQTTVAPSECSPEIPLSISNVKVNKASNGDTFDFNDWVGSSTVNYVLSVTNGVINSTSGSIY